METTSVWLSRLVAAIGLALTMYAVAGGCNGGADGGADGGVRDASPDITCAATLKRAGGACAPVLDDCKDDEVPVPGGGCKRVGVKECPGGIEAPPSWACKPVGPPTTCLTGWAKVSGGWCEPILPAATCAKGTMQVIGKATCEPIGNCGSGRWGEIKTTVATIFVDGSYNGGGSDGSQAKPFTTIAAAIKTAPASGGGQIAVAAGTYKESVLIDRSLTLAGRCAQQVTIQGQDPKLPGVGVAQGAGAARPVVALSGLTVTAPQDGVGVKSADLSLDRIAVTGCGLRGVVAYYAAKLTMRDCLVANNAGRGVDVSTGSTALVERTEVRGTQPWPTYNTVGFGLQVWTGNTSTLQPSLTLRSSVVVNNRTAGIYQSGGTLVVEQSVIKDTLPQTADKRLGVGIWTSNTGMSSQPWSTLTVRDSLIADNRTGGIGADDADVTVERTVVRDTLPDGLGMSATWGGVSVLSVKTAKQSSLKLQDVLVRGNWAVGVLTFGARATIKRSVVEETRFKADQAPNGFGIAAQKDQSKRASALTVEDSVVRNNGLSGVILGGGSATVERTVVRDTKSVRTKFGFEAGTGLNFGVAKATIKDVLVSGNTYAGVTLYGGETSVARTVIRGSRPNSGDGIGGFGVFASPDSSSLPTVTLEDTRIDGSHGTGLGLYSPKRVTVDRCLVKDTSTGKLPSTAGLKTGWGDGITFATYPGGTASVGALRVVDSRVESSARVGLLLEGGSGKVGRSLFRTGALPIALEGGSTVSIGDDNHYEGNKEDEVGTSRGLKPAPPPTLPTK